MVYRKTYRKRGYRKRSAKPASVRRIVRQEVNKAEESKMWDGAQEAISISSTGSSYYLFNDPNTSNTIVNGPADGEYVGTKVKVSHITMRGMVAAADSFNTLRLLVIQSKGVFVPSGTTVFQTTYGLSSPFLGLNKAYDDRYRVIVDRMITVDATDTTKQFKIMIPGKRLYPTHFSDASGTAENGGLYVVMVSNSTLASHPVVSIAWRVFYKDS